MLTASWTPLQDVSHTGATCQGWISGSPQLGFPADEKPCGADQPARLGEEPRGAAENAGERRGRRRGIPRCPRGRPHPAVPPQRNSTVAGRLAAEARTLWQMQNSTVQSQEALVVSPCRAGGSGAAGTAQRCPLEGNDGAFEPFSPPCHTGKAGGKRPVPLPLGTAPKGTCESLPALKIMRCPGGPIC